MPPNHIYSFNRLVVMMTAGVIVLAQLSACAPIVIGGAAATTAMMATDRRTAGEQVDDKAIDVKINFEARKVLGENPGRVSGSSYAGQVLLVGDVPTAQDSQHIAAAVKQIDSVKEVINRLRVGAPTELSVRTNDSWITTKVTTALINAKDVPSRTISVTTERGIVYLQGLVTQQEGDRAARAASTVPGVTEVVKLFEYVSAEKVLLPQKSSTEQKANTASPIQEAAPPTNTSQPEIFTIDS